MFDLMTMMIYVLSALLVYSIIRFVYIRKKNNEKIKTLWGRELILACLVAYGAAMFTLLFMHSSAGFTGFIDKSYLNPIERLAAGVGVNLIPFKSITDFLSMLDNPYMDSSGTVIRNLLGNIFLFTPIGLAMTLLWRRWQKWLSMILFALFLPVGVEFIQLFIGRSVDIDDVILNFTGIMLGFLFAKLLLKLFPRFQQKYIG